MRWRRSPLPVLFMRFVIQTLAAAPKLRSFVLDILSTLVRVDDTCTAAFCDLQAAGTVAEKVSCGACR